MHISLKTISIRYKIAFVTLLLSGILLVIIGYTNQEISTVIVGLFNLIFLVTFYFLLGYRFMRVENTVFKFWGMFSVSPQIVEISNIETIQLKYFSDARSRSVIVLLLNDINHNSFSIPLNAPSKSYIAEVLNMIGSQNRNIKLIKKDSSIVSMEPGNIEQVIKEAYSEFSKFKLGVPFSS